MIGSCKQNNKNKIGVAALLAVAAIAVFTAMAHMSCLVLGESCYRAQLAPEVIVNSATEGTWIAPAGTLFVSALFLICAIYAASAAKLIKPVPFLRLGIFTISGLCLLRGAATWPLSIMFPDKVTMFSIVAGIVWLVSGVLCLAGYFLVNHKYRKSE